MEDAARTLLSAYLYADPAAHSLSPQMHRAAFAWAGLNGQYEAVRVPAAELPEMVARLRAADTKTRMLGANLSLPHKETVLPLLDSLSDAARRIGAVNTVVNRGGQLFGDNTDAPGLLAALYDAGFVGNRDGLGQGGPVVVLGAGGAARAAVYAALVGLERDVYIHNRTRQRAEELAQAWAHSDGVQPGAEFQVRAADLSEIPWADVSLMINSSSAGLNDPDQSPLPGFDFAQTRAAVYDMVYKPAETRLMRDARAAGLRAENGLGMLAHQARLAFKLWTAELGTGQDVPVSVFLGALREALHEALHEPLPESLHESLQGGLGAQALK